MHSFLLLAALAADPVPTDAAEMPPLVRGEAPAKTLLGQPRAFFADFESADVAPFQPTDADAWKVKDQGDNKVFALTVRKSDYQPPVRSPHNIALVKDLSLTETIIDVDFQSTMTDYGHRSLCLFFNYQDPSHFYYVHFGKEADPHANQIFVVDGKPRTKISKTTTDGTPWDDQWHHARVVRKPATGEISVYFDDMENPVMTAVDKTFTHGQVGIGSFDDAGAFDNLAVYGRPATDAASE
ncbi:hypothetical protein [Alienimonas chondri]|uniref:LamG domain-containing protein n=1 Tax=Alienimonas chondri TaxID=2681879 RepID=A0ABX1VK45_9PLAN|nr:hypothetical protein [Alienimonas chondri]NNJ27815.1 hypothetical protein [Alienimonas chondri]